ncbi:MAG: methyltransferase [Bacteroidales bacterium]|nr:methyltransferase [Bacteroidales bacterium]
MKNLTFTFLLLVFAIPLFSQTNISESELDKKVLAYLKNNDSKWESHHIPESDGKAFYDIIIKNQYKSVVEIGTSTGYSTIWLAWALSKTGGKLITIEIDKERYETALKNFKEVGLAEFIDARLANAHEFVYKLNGTIDFVLMDADISTDYFKALAPKLIKGGVYITHGNRSEDNDYAKYLKGYKDFETNFKTGGGFCLSKKK